MKKSAIAFAAGVLALASSVNVFAGDLCVYVVGPATGSDYWTGNSAIGAKAPDSNVMEGTLYLEANKPFFFVSRAQMYMAGSAVGVQRTDAPQNMDFVYFIQDQEKPYQHRVTTKLGQGSFYLTNNSISTGWRFMYFPNPNDLNRMVMNLDPDTNGWRIPDDIEAGEATITVNLLDNSIDFGDAKIVERVDPNPGVCVHLTGTACYDGHWLGLINIPQSAENNNVYDATIYLNAGTFKFIHHNHESNGIEYVAPAANTVVTTDGTANDLLHGYVGTYNPRNPTGNYFQVESAGWYHIVLDIANNTLALTPVDFADEEYNNAKLEGTALPVGQIAGVYVWGSSVGVTDNPTDSEDMIPLRQTDPAKPYILSGSATLGDGEFALCWNADASSSTKRAFIYHLEGDVTKTTNVNHRDEASCITWNVPSEIAQGEALLTLNLKDKTLTVKGAQGDISGIENVGVDRVDTPAVYYNLQGIRIENPANGVYIRRQGNKTTKVFL